MKFEDQPVGTYALYQFVDPGSSGPTVSLGYFATARRATEAARAIAPISKLQGNFHATFKRSDQRTGAMVDGYTISIELEPRNDYFPDQEIVLSDGRVVWLGDVEHWIQQGLELEEMAKS